MPTMETILLPPKITPNQFWNQLADVGGTNYTGENASEAIGVTTAQEFALAEVAGWFEVSATG
jgi:hypothetical protein